MQLVSATGNLASMTQTPTTPWREGEEDDYVADPKAFLLDKCSLWMGGIKWKQNFVVAATYYLPPYEILPNGTKFYRTETSQDEALWQGKCGLVIGKGPLAFVNDERNDFRGQNIEIGEWILWDIHDARQTTIHRMHLRFIPDTKILATIPDPRLIY